jgi:hypothetical protein
VGRLGRGRACEGERWGGWVEGERERARRRGGGEEGEGAGGGEISPLPVFNYW